MSPIGNENQDKLFCLNASKYKLKKLILKAVAMAESSLDENATRYEPGFWNSQKAYYLGKYPELASHDLVELGTSYGLFQLMFPVAWSLGFRGTGEELCNPVYNVELGAKLIRQLLDGIAANNTCDVHFWLSPLVITLARYNGGFYQNPDDNGALRNQKYVTRVLSIWEDLKTKNGECQNV